MTNPQDLTMMGLTNLYSKCFQMPSTLINIHLIFQKILNWFFGLFYLFISNIKGSLLTSNSKPFLPKFQFSPTLSGSEADDQLRGERQLLLNKERPWYHPHGQWPFLNLAKEQQFLEIKREINPPSLSRKKQKRKLPVEPEKKFLFLAIWRISFSDSTKACSKRFPRGTPSAF